MESRDGARQARPISRQSVRPVARTMVHSSTAFRSRFNQGAFPQIELDCYSMSNMPRIADQIPHRSETTLSANNGRRRRGAEPMSAVNQTRRFGRSR
jgi:hypothetical protein